jgi:hypothetical protein
MPYAAPSGSNTYVPSYEASEPVIQLSRDPSKYRVNQYTKIMPVSKDQGLYLRLDPDEQARIVDEADYAWEDGADAPKQEDKQEHEFVPYRTLRRHYGFRIGYKSAAQATWQILAAHARMVLNKAMLIRTIKANELIWNAANWGVSTAAADNAALGGVGATAWSTSTTAQTFILKTLMGAAERIDFHSNGVISDIDSLILLISPGMARRIRQSPEFNDYLRGSPEALASLTGALAHKNPNFKYGLPEFMYGFKIVVDNAIRFLNRKGDTVNKTRVVPDNAVAILSRPEGVVGESDMPMDFSTIAFRFYEQATVESKDDPDNRRHLGRVVEDFVCTLQAPQTGFLITGIV